VSACVWSCGGSTEGPEDGSPGDAQDAAAADAGGGAADTGGASDSHADSGGPGSDATVNDSGESRADSGVPFDATAADSALGDSAVDSQVFDAPPDTMAGDSGVTDSGTVGTGDGGTGDGAVGDAATEDGGPSDDAGDASPSLDSGGESDGSEDGGADAADAADAAVSFVRACGGSDPPPVYLITNSGHIYPLSLSTLTVGTAIAPDCPSGAGGAPNSMGIDNAGNAYIDYSNGTVQIVNLGTAACTEAPFAQPPASALAIHFIQNGPDAGGRETLYVANQDGNPATLYSVGLPAWTTTSVGPVGGSSPVAIPEFTGSDDGTMYALYADQTSWDLHIATVDRQTAALSNDYDINIGDAGLNDPQWGVAGYAFIEWNGTFYVFFSEPTVTYVYAFVPPSTLTLVQTFTGAGISGVSKTGCSP
jgi:hypothetical protein